MVSGKDTVALCPGFRLTRWKPLSCCGGSWLAAGSPTYICATSAPVTDPVLVIVALAFCFGFFSSLQYTCLNTLVYADVSTEQTSGASSIASTTQQMSISFSVAGASLVTALFIPDRFDIDAHEMIHGLHQTFFVLGGLTLLSTIVFWELRADDGANVRQHVGKMPEHG